MSSGMHAYFRLVVKKMIHNRSIRQPPTTTKYIIDLDFVKMKLFDEIVPKTCRNFAELCTHQQGFGYAGSSFHHVVRGFGLYGGDIVNRVEARQPYHVDNTGLSWSGKVESWKKPEPLPMPSPELGQCGRSIYTRLKSERVYEDESFFEDESFKIQHDQAGVLTMANRGLPHTNDSRFVILTIPAPHLDQKNVAFGQVVEGMDVIHEIDKVCGSQSGHPLHYVEIVQCGVLADVEQPFPAKTALEDLNRRETRDPKAYTREPIYVE